MASQPTRIVIVGAGFSGLATAYELLQRLPDAEITVLEAQQRMGGMLRTDHLQDYLVEWGPVSFSGCRLGVMKLCHRLGMMNQLIEQTPFARKRWILHQDGVLLRIPTDLSSALTSPLFGMGSAFQLVTERLRFSGAGKNPLDESVYQFVERRVGKELALIISDALCSEVFTQDGKAISVRAGFPQLARAELKHGNVTGGYHKLLRAERNAAGKAGIKLTVDWRDHFSFKKGLQELIDALHHRLKQPVVLGLGVTSIVPAAEGLTARWLVKSSDESTRPADYVILACPAYKQAAILADTDAELADALLGIPYAGIITLALGYQRVHVPSLVESHSILLPQRFKRDALKIVFTSSIFPGRAPPGHVLMQIAMAGVTRREMLSWDDDALILSARRELRNMLKITRPPQFAKLTRWPRSIPQYTLGHGQRVKKIEELASKYHGLILAGNALHGVSLHDTAMQAERIARQIRDRVKAS